MKKQYNIIEFRSRVLPIPTSGMDDENPRDIGYDSILLVEGGDFNNSDFSRPAIRTNFDRIVLSKRKYGEELTFESKNNRLIGYDVFGEEVCSVDGFIFTLNQKPFEDEDSARLFFEIC